MKIKASVIGGSGYTGAELLRLLLGHPEVEIIAATSERYAGKLFSEINPNLIGITVSSYEKMDLNKIAGSSDLVFTALPHGRSMEVVPQLIEKGCRVIDISGDFRLKNKEAYKDWYRFEHKAADLLQKSVYGLCELNTKDIKKASLVANPGCYPTSVILGLAPAVSRGLVFEQDIVVDSMSGVSGAGRTAAEITHFCSCADNVSSYKVGGVHQHIPEMEYALSDLSEDTVTLSFTPHLLPVSRGIYSTVYADLKNDIALDEAIDTYRSFYKDSFFVEVLREGEYPQLKAVIGTNFCHLGISVDLRCGRLIIISAIDNLVKGAAGQAIQNMNIMNGLDEKTGLDSPALYP
jgi:N-acetyl-gamma-glutamyl-phosphate reductase